MKTILRYASLCIIVITLLFSGCLGGDENKEAWNDEVSDINDFIMDGMTSYEAFEDAFDNQLYDIAYLNLDDAKEQYEDALNDLDDLREIADDLDEGFLDDYLDAWEGNLGELVNISNADLFLTAIMDFNNSRSNFFSYNSDASTDLNQAIAYYNDDLLALAIDSANSASGKYASAISYLDRMPEIGSLLDMPYISTYSALLSSATQSLIDASSYIIQAANYKESDIGQANQYVTMTENRISESKDYNSQILDLYGTYTELYEQSNGLVLGEMYSYYQSIKMDSMVAANDYREEMEGIVEENEDFFE